MGRPAQAAMTTHTRPKPPRVIASPDWGIVPSARSCFYERLGPGTVNSAHGLPPCVRRAPLDIGTPGCTSRSFDGRLRIDGDDRGPTTRG